jgi:hypothetical protein
MKQASDESQRQARIIEDAYSEYIRAVRDAWVDATEKSWAAYKEHLSEVQDKSLEADKRSAESDRKYMRTLIESWDQADPQAFSADAYYDNYNERLEISSLTQQAIAKAGQTYANRLFQISVETEKRSREAERKYVIATQPAQSQEQPAGPAEVQGTTDAGRASQHRAVNPRSRRS